MITACFVYSCSLAPHTWGFICEWWIRWSGNVLEHGVSIYLLDHLQSRDQCKNNIFLQSSCIYQEKTSWYARIWLIKAVVLTASSVWHTGIHDIYGINVWNILVQLYVFYYTALIERLDQWKRPMKEWCGVLPGIQWAIFWQLDQMTTPRKYWHLNVKFQYADWYIVHERQYLRNK